MKHLDYFCLAVLAYGMISTDVNGAMALAGVLLVLVVLVRFFKWLSEDE